jgi:hypothetical protein
MKNFKTKYALYLILSVASIFSTIYVNTQQPVLAETNEAAYGNSGYLNPDEFEEEANNTPFLDIRLIQKAVETGKNLIPAN